MIAGFEIQVDDNAIGDSTKDFYGIRPEPNGLYKNRTGAIYKIQAGDRIWHLNRNEPTVQNYTPGPALVPGIWFEYEIVVKADDYSVFLTNTQTGERKQTTSFHNADAETRPQPRLYRRASVFRQHCGVAPHPHQAAVTRASRFYLLMTSAHH